MIQPLLIRDFIKYFNGQVEFKWALINGTIICLNTLINCLVPHPFYYSVVRQGMRMRIAVCGLIYRKVFRELIKSIKI